MTLRGLGLGVLGWLLASCVYGQFTLSGTVTDTRGQILPGAAVLVEENIRLGVTTDRDGQFSIVFPSEGPWTVKASFVGHSSETERITFQRPNMTRRFKLSPGNYDVFNLHSSGRLERSKPFLHQCNLICPVRCFCKLNFYTIKLACLCDTAECR